MRRRRVGSTPPFNLQGFVGAIKALKTVGYLSREPNDFLNPVQGPDLSWKQITASLMNQQQDIFPDSLKNIVMEKLGREKTRELEALEEFGLVCSCLIKLFVSNLSSSPTPTQRGTTTRWTRWPLIWPRP
jgi:saccharopine dehydrogenase-like NADP-dependent oxidoreductase